MIRVCAGDHFAVIMNLGQVSWSNGTVTRTATTSGRGGTCRSGRATRPALPRGGRHGKRVGDAGCDLGQHLAA